MDGGVFWHLHPAAAGHRSDGRHPAGDGAGHGAAAAAGAVDRGAVRRQHRRRRARCAGQRLLAGARAGPGAHGGPVRGAQPAVRRRGAVGVFAAGRHCGGCRRTGYRQRGATACASPSQRAGQAGRHRPARHRLRGGGGAGAQPGDRGHGLHLCAAAGGLSGGQRAGRGGLPALASGRAAARRQGRTRGRRCVHPSCRPLGRQADLRAGCGLPAGRRQPVGRRVGQGHLAGPLGQQPGRGAGRRGAAGLAGLRPAHGGDGGAVWPPQRPRQRSRCQLRPIAGRQHTGRGGRATAVRRARHPGAGAQVGAAADCRGLPGAGQPAGLAPRAGLVSGLGPGRRRPGVGRLGAAAGLCRPARGRPAHQLPGGRDGGRQRGAGRRGRVPAAHQQPAARRQQFQRPRRCPAGLAAGAVAPGAAACAVSGPGHRHDRNGRGGRPRAQGRCGRAAARGHPCVGPLHRGGLRQPGQQPGRRPAGATTAAAGGGCPAFCAHQHPGLRRHRLGQLSPSAQRLGLAVHG